MKKFLRKNFALLAIIATGIATISNSTGPGGDNTGSPNDSGQNACTQSGCHGGNALNSGGGSISSNLPATYYPGDAISVTMTLTHPGSSTFGFQGVFLTPANTQAGTLTSSAGMTLGTAGSVSHIKHNMPSATGVWTFTWTAPATAQTVTFFYAGNGANGNGNNSGDFIYNSSSVITGLNLITTTETITDEGCFGSCNGSISLAGTAGGAGAPFSYLWSNAATTANVNNLCADTYTVTITDNGGNEEVISYVVGGSPEIIPHLVATPSSCATGDGQIETNPTGGTPPYTYLWNTGATTNIILNAASGSYSVTITDANGCQVDSSDNVGTNGSGLEGDFVLVNEGCDQDNGSLTLNMTVGNAPFTYAWSNGGSVTNSITGISAGTYFVTVTDANGCTEAFGNIVNNVFALIDEPNTNVTDAACFGELSGSINVDVQSGQEPFSFAWSDGSTGNPLTNVSAGVYTVTLTDNSGCTDVATFTILQPDSIGVTITKTNADGTNCDGTISVSASGGAGGFTYAWSHDAALIASEAQDLCIGAYSVTTTDAIGCEIISDITISDVTGVSEIDNDFISIFPNPSAGVLYLSGNWNSVKAMQLIDLSGRTVKSWTNLQSNELSLTEIETGRYILVIESGSNIEYESLILMR